MYILRGERSGRYVYFGHNKILHIVRFLHYVGKNKATKKIKKIESILFCRNTSKKLKFTKCRGLALLFWPKKRPNMTFFHTWPKTNN